MSNSVMENKQCLCPREAECFSPYFQYKCRLVLTGRDNDWMIEAVNGYGERETAIIIDAKYCPWCGGLLESWKEGIA